ncbi:MAG: ATP-binding protein [Lentisphaeria bacterium]|nr:ATP-binding protein [Lentisphaeria bacterium]
MEFSLYSYLLVFLELNFVFIALLLLHRLRQNIGPNSFYVATGALLIFAQIIQSLQVEIVHGLLPGLNVTLGPVIYGNCFIAMLLIIYIIDGTYEAQRFILSMFFVVAIFFYLAYMTERQITFPMYEISPDINIDSAKNLFSHSRTFILTTLLSILIEFFLLPIVYEIMRHRNFGVSFSVLIALVFTQVIDTFFYQLVTHPIDHYWLDSLRHSYISRAAAMLWISLLCMLYLRMHNAQQKHQISLRKPMDILLAFVGTYNPTMKAQKNIQEWEGRFRMIFENTQEMIILVNSEGRILDANKRTISVSQYDIYELLHLSVQNLFRNEINWDSVWNTLFVNVGYGHYTKTGKMIHKEVKLVTKSGNLASLEVSITSLFFQGNYGVLIVGKDVTEKKRLESELENKQEQLVHSQRMEAVGKLAGGIAHDFNNLLHSIQGSIDNLDRRVGSHPENKQLLNNISTATFSAANLTNQLLGFARAGKYEIKTLVAGEIVEQTVELFKPLARKKVKVRVGIHPDPILIEGDYTQLQQVILNLLLNAMDAMQPQNENKITVRCEPARDESPGFANAPSDVYDLDSNYVLIRIKDNGQGIPKDTLKRIFEPFFTTKEAKGTGMGLAMAQGCIANHNGWIHVETKPQKGTEFFIYLPIKNNPGKTQKRYIPQELIHSEN